MTSSNDREGTEGDGGLPRNRARVLIVSAVVLIVVVVFGYMLLVSLTR